MPFKPITIWRFLRRNPGIAAVLGLGLALSLALFIGAERREQSLLQSVFQRQAEDRVAAIAHELQERLEDLTTLGLLCGSKRGLDPDEFHQVAAQLRSGDPCVQAFEWVLRVPRHRRQEFEQAARHCSLDVPAARHASSPFQITELRPDGSLASAAEREEYYPVYLVEPAAGNESALGLDLASEPLRRQLLSRTLATGTMTATPTLPLVQGPGQQRGFLVQLPVYEPEPPPASDRMPTASRPEPPPASVPAASTNQLRGLITQALRLGECVEYALNRLTHVGIDVLVLDPALSGPEALLHTHWSPVRLEPAPATLPPVSNWRQGLFYQATVPVADRQWLLLLKPTSAFLAAHKSWQPEGVLATGLLLTAMLTAYLTVNARRAAQLARANQELAHSNQLLHAEIAERRRAEQALRLPLFAIEHASDAIFWVGPDARFTYANHAASRLLGYSPQELLSLAVHQVEPARPQHTWPARWQEYKRQKSLTREATLRTKNASLVTVELTVNHFEYEGQEYNCTFARDITQRKQAEEALRAAEQRWRTIFEYAPDAYYLHDLQGTFINGNKAAELTIGYPREELIGQSFLDLNLLDHEQLAKASAGLARNARGEATGPDEFILTRKDGRLLPVEIRTHPVRLADQVLVLGIARNITERKEAEAFASSINALLQLLARTTSRKDYLDAVLELLGHATACRCVGIRILPRHGCLPYESCVGFSPEFWAAQNWLSHSQTPGACTRILTGHPLPEDLSAMTPGGSFYCPSLQDPAPGLSPEERSHYSARSLDCGLPSLAIVPIRHQQEILGALHLADDTPGKLSSRMLSSLETMAPLIAEALHRLSIEEQVRWHGQTQALVATLLRLAVGPAALEEFLKEAFALILAFPWRSFESRGVLYLADPDTRQLLLLAHRGMDCPSNPLPLRLPLPLTLCQQTSLTAPPQSCQAHSCPLHACRSPQQAPLICAPLLSADQPVGALGLALSHPQAPDPQDHHFFLALADVLVGIIQRRRAEQALLRSETLVRASLKEKEVLLKEVHHRVKNNLQVICSLLELQSASLHETDPTKAFQESQLRVRTIAMVHERLYQSADLAHIDFAAYAQSLTALLLASYGHKACGVQLTLAIEDTAALSLGQAIPCGLIINELVSNALKHAFPLHPAAAAPASALPSASQPSALPSCAPEPQGLLTRTPKQIQVALRRHEQHWLLSVRDNGVGLPETFELTAAASTLGMTIVSLLAHQLGGTLALSRQGGTTFSITFPLA